VTIAFWRPVEAEIFFLGTCVRILLFFLEVLEKSLRSIYWVLASIGKREKGSFLPLVMIVLLRSGSTEGIKPLIGKVCIDGSAEGDDLGEATTEELGEGLGEADATGDGSAISFGGGDDEHPDSPSIVKSTKKESFLSKSTPPKIKNLQS